MQPTLLLVEDDPDGARSVAEVAGGAGFSVIVAREGEAGIERFRERTPDLVLTDLVLPDISGIDVLTRLQQMDRRVPVILMTAYGSVDSSVKALRAGAYDYIQKPLNLEELESTLRRAMEASRLRRQVDSLSASVRERYSARAMVANSPAMQAVIRQIEALADTMATVLIQGESGTGKELVARALHADSRRASGPFVAVNCGAFAESLLESELFGHEKGAFTGAASQHKGAFERADGGTLLLDEIGDAPAPVQVKLLRALEDREIRRIGGQQPFRVDVRLISATNRDLTDLVAEGDFREDLLYRINVVTLTVPPLRRRREDIRPLADRFIARACEEHGRAVARVDPRFYEALEACDWPGNVRQLRNVVESAVLLSSGDALSPDVVPLPEGAGRRTVAATGAFAAPDGMSLAEIEREVLLQTLTRCQGNRTLSAERLGLSRRTVQRKIKEHGLPF
jgi:DNA-binding NtrC family response regulator